MNFELGTVQVTTERNEYSSRIEDVLCGDKETIAIVLSILKEAVAADRAQAVNTLTDNGMDIAAMLIRRA